MCLCSGVGRCSLVIQSLTFGRPVVPLLHKIIETAFDLLTGIGLKGDGAALDKKSLNSVTADPKGFSVSNKTNFCTKFSDCATCVAFSAANGLVKMIFGFDKLKACVISRSVYVL